MAEVAGPYAGVLWPDEIASENGVVGWLPRAPGETASDAASRAALAFSELEGAPADRWCLTPVLMREESPVEADIAGHEFQLMVECTERARAPDSYWRVELRSGLSDTQEGPKDG